MDRKKFLHTLGEKKADKSFDQFTQRALNGYSYLPKEVSAQSLLQEIDKKIDLQTTTRKSNIRRLLPMLLSVAASVLILVVTGIWLLSTPIDAPSADLFTNYFEPLAVAIPQTGIDRGPTAYDHPVSRAEEALKKYEEGAFEPANKLFESLPLEQMEQVPIRFYYSLSLLSAGQQDAAIVILEKLALEVKDTKYLENIQWYLALAYIKSGTNDKAESPLKALQNSSYYQHKAASLLNEL